MAVVLVYLLRRHATYWFQGLSRDYSRVTSETKQHTGLDLEAS